MRRPRKDFFISVLLLALLISATRTYADNWQPWQTVKGAHIAWHYEWDSDWNEYDIEIRNDYDHAITVKFVVSCGNDKSVGFWSLKSGAKGSFLQRFPKGGLKVPLHLQIADLYGN